MNQLLFCCQGIGKHSKDAEQNDIYIKNGLSVEGLSYMFTINSSDLKERFIKSSEYLGKFLALFLQLTDRDSNKILNKFNNSL